MTFTGSKNYICRRIFITINSHVSWPLQTAKAEIENHGLDRVHIIKFKVQGK